MHPPPSNPDEHYPLWVDNPLLSFYFQFWIITITVVVTWYLTSFLLSLFVGYCLLQYIRYRRRIWISKSTASDVTSANRTFKEFRRQVMWRIREGVNTRRVRNAERRYSRRRTRRAISTTEDSIEIPNLFNIPYSHGGFFGAAPFMLSIDRWLAILRQLMPDVYCEVARRVFARSHYLIHWAENNPVCCAFGAINSLGIETPDCKEDFGASLGTDLNTSVEEAETAPLLDTSPPPHSQSAPTNHQIVIEWDVFLSPNHVNILRDHPNPRNSNLLFETMMIAHGSTPQLVIEQAGFFSAANFSRVKRSKKSLGGGMTALSWIQLYARALSLGVSNSNPPSTSLPMPPPNYFNDLEEDDLTLESALQEIENITKQPLKLFLDLKSRYVPKQVWADLILHMRKIGIQVTGVGSFVISELRGISSLVGGTVEEVFFFHTCGDLQRALHKGWIKNNDTIFFNAGSMLWEFPNTPKKFKGSLTSAFTLLWAKGGAEEIKMTYKLRPYALCNPPDTPPPLIPSLQSTLQHYVSYYNLNVGVYVQEFAIDEVAASILITHVNCNPHVFNKGMAWGGISGKTISGVQPSTLGNTDGLWAQRLVGRSWDGNRSPGEIPNPAGMQNKRR